MHSSGIQAKSEVKSTRWLFYIYMLIIVVSAYALFVGKNYDNLSLINKIFFQFLAIFFLYGYLIWTHNDLVYDKNKIIIYNFPVFRTKSIKLSNIISVEGSISGRNIVKIKFLEQHKKHITYIYFPDATQLETLKVFLITNDIKVAWNIFYDLK
jgi:hypothetical protein